MSHESPLLPVQQGFNVPVDPGQGALWVQRSPPEPDAGRNTMRESIYVLTVDPLKQVSLVTCSTVLVCWYCGVIC